MILYNAKLGDVVELVNHLNRKYSLNLDFRGTSDGRAAWLIGNCAITTTAIGNITRVELDDFSWNGETADAHAAATKLFRHLSAHFVEIDAREYPDELEQIANNTIARMKSRDRFDYAQILARADLDAEARAQIEARRDARDAHERERVRRKQLTADVWLKEFFGAGEPRAETTKQPTWRGNGEPPKTRAEKIKAIQAWDAIPRDERPRLEDWLLENFGTDYATEKPNVIESTFHSWRRLKNS